MLRTIYSCFREYILFRRKLSLWNYFRFWWFKETASATSLIPFRLIGQEGTVYLRRNKADFSVFKDIFLKDDYAPTVPRAKRIIDAGANIGASSILLKNRYPDAEIVAIEPDLSNCGLFRKNTEIYSGISLRQGGLASRHNCFMEIVDTNVAAYSFQLQYSDSGLPSYSIAGLMQEMGWDEVDIVKIDIEGGEKELFSSNIEWISRVRQIVVELHDYKVPGCSSALINAIAGIDFVVSFSGENLILTRSKSWI